MSEDPFVEGTYTLGSIIYCFLARNKKVKINRTLPICSYIHNWNILF